MAEPAVENGPVELGLTKRKAAVASAFATAATAAGRRVSGSGALGGEEAPAVAVATGRAPARGSAAATKQVRTIRGAGLLYYAKAGKPLGPAGAEALASPLIFSVHHQKFFDERPHWQLRPPHTLPLS